MDPHATAAPANDPVWSHPKYKLKRKVLKLIGGAFYIVDMNDQLCFYVHQKGFKLKEDIRVYRDEQMTREVLTIKARQVMDFSGAYDVIDPATGQKIGMLPLRRTRGMFAMRMTPRTRSCKRIISSSRCCDGSCQT